MKEPQSPPLQLLCILFRHYERKSWDYLNHAAYDILKQAICGNMTFYEGDWDLLRSQFRYGYWGGTSTNGHHTGEGHYAEACQWNPSAVKEYERCFGRTPFILSGKRLYQYAEFDTPVTDSQPRLFWKVTGWGKQNDALTVVGYENRRNEGKRRQKQFTQKEWNEFRKECFWIS